MPNITIYLKNKTYAKFMLLKDSKKTKIKTDVQKHIEKLIEGG